MKNNIFIDLFSILIVIFLILIIISSIPMISDYNAIQKFQKNYDTYGQNYHISQNTIHDSMVNMSIAPYVYSSVYGITSTEVGTSIYSLVINSGTELLNTTFNNDFSKIISESLISIPLPTKYNFIDYLGLVYYNNTFTTLEQIGYSANTPYYLITFNSKNILVNRSINFQPSNWGINNVGGINLLYSIQGFNSTVYSIRIIDNITSTGTFKDFILTEYSLPQLNIIKNKLISTSNDSLNINQITKLDYTGFIIDDKGNAWVSFANDASIDNTVLRYKINLQTLTLEGTLFCPHGSYFTEGCNSADNFNFASNNNITYQIPQKSYTNVTTLSIMNIYNFGIGIQSNHYFEMITTYFLNSHIYLIGFRVSTITKDTAPTYDLYVSLSILVISVIGIIISGYVFYKEKNKLYKNKNK